MKKWRIVMGMPVTIEIADDGATADEVARETDPGQFLERHMEAQIDRLFAYFEHVEKVFSPYRPASETSRVNHGLLRVEDASDEMKTVLRLWPRKRASRPTATSTSTVTGSSTRWG